MVNKIFAMVVMALLVSCRGELHLAPKDYLKWFEDKGHGFIQTKKFNDLIFNVQLKPINYLLLKEMDGIESEEIIGPEEMKKKKEELKGMQYYTFRILSADGQSSVLKSRGYSKEILMDRLAYVSYDLQNDFKLLDGNDTLPCILFNYVRNYDLAPTLDFVLAFPEKSANAKDKTFIYDDKLFGFGTLQFFFDKSIITDQPSLKI